MYCPSCRKRVRGQRDGVGSGDYACENPKCSVDEIIIYFSKEKRGRKI